MAVKNKDKGRKFVLKDVEKLETSDEKKKSSRPMQKEVLTLFLFLLPILLMAYTQEMFTKIALFFYEAVLLQNYIVDQYHKRYT